MQPPSHAVAVRPAVGLSGRVEVPGDKSVSHRALILGALGDGPCQVRGLLRSADTDSTRSAMQALGLQVDDLGPGHLRLRPPPAGLQEPRDVLDCGNSGTTIRLLCGLLAGAPLHAVLTGDDSLRRRPMGRVVEPLRRLGAQVDGRQDGRLAPLAVRGKRPLAGGRLELPVASAQVKSALLLAGLHAEAPLELVEPGPSRDHSERMLGAMGARLARTALPDGRILHRLEPGATLAAVDRLVPGDVSSAAFLLVAATLSPGSSLRLEGVGLNPTRTGVLDVLARMGADVRIEEARDEGGEPVGTLVVRHARLRATTVGGAEVVRLIDEVPILAVAAAFAEGETRFTDAEELRVKESDRVTSTVALVRALGGQAEELPDGLVVQGSGGRPLAGGLVHSRGDHRIAMAGAVGGLCCAGGVRVDDADAASVSWPDFYSTLARLGAEVQRA